jgi:hypothetical protein
MRVSPPKMGMLPLITRVLAPTTRDFAADGEGVGTEKWGFAGMAWLLPPELGVLPLIDEGFAACNECVAADNEGVAANGAFLTWTMGIDADDEGVTACNEDVAVGFLRVLAPRTWYGRW